MDWTDMYQRNRKIAEGNEEILHTGRYTADGVPCQLHLSPEEWKQALVLYPEALARIRERAKSLYSRFTACRIQTVNGDTMDHSLSLVLNFANALQPGGGYLSGSNAQEECLCRESTLYASLTSDESAGMYEYNLSNPSPVVSDILIFSPAVEIFRAGSSSGYTLLKQTRFTAVFTVPAPDVRGTAENILQKEIDQVMKWRIENILSTAALFRYPTLTLGAWGCCVFGHDTAKVAAYFHDVLYSENMIRFFSDICFAIWDTSENQYNYHAFSSLFKTDDHHNPGDV